MRTPSVQRQAMRKIVVLIRTICSCSERSTIFALSSGKGRSAVSLIRVSGPRAICCLTLMTRLKNKNVKPREMFFTHVRHPVTEEILDRGMAVYLPAPRTFTGEDSAELFVHGGEAVVSGVLKALSEIPGYRMAEPGEFARRSFSNGKLDLTEIEGLADLLRAETSAQRRLALSQASGSLRSLYADWRQRILKVTSRLEAHIDFGEEDCLEPELIQSVRNDAKSLEQDLETHLEHSLVGERLRSGVKISIIGPPNVGKSSLLNLLCADPERAIVSSTPGTTRDFLDVHLDIGGFPVVLTDTAGVRSPKDPIEEEGARRAKNKFLASDLALVMTDCTSVLASGDSVVVHAMKTLQDIVPLADSKIVPKLVVVVNKMDLDTNAQLEGTLNASLSRSETPLTFISCWTSSGYSDLMNILEKQLESMCHYSSSSLLTQLRHRNAVERALQELQGFSAFIDVDCVVAAQKLRNTLFELGKITGAVSTEEILDSIFSEFCIGK